MTVHVVAVGSGANIYSLQPKVIQVQENGRTTKAYNHDVTLQRTKPLNKFSIEAFNEQKLSLEDAASVALTSFDPVLIRGIDFNSTLKMELVYSSIKDGDPTFTGMSAGLSYGISLSLLWAKHANIFDYQSKRNTPVYATGELPQGGGSVLAIEHLQDKLKAVCDYVESLSDAELQSMPDSQDEDQPAFFFFYPKDNKGANAESDDASTRASWKALRDRARILNGKLIPATNLRDAMLELLGEKGLKEGLHSNRSFPGIEPILWEEQQLFKGRSGLLTNLEVTARSAYASKKIMTVEGKSGSGKSSAVLGGMATRLVDSVHGTIFRPPHRITPASFDSLQDLLKGLLYDITNDDDRLDQWTQIEQPDQLAGQIQDYLKEQHQKAEANTHSDTRNNPIPSYFWVIDQAEELFTHSLYAPHVINQLHRYLEVFATQLDVLIISINRQEYSSDIPWLIDGSDTNIQVSAPSSEELRVLIKEQMDTRRLNLELTTPVQTKKLEQRILEDAQGLPLTAIGALLQEMHQLKVKADPAGKVLKHDYYDAAGGAKGAMAQLAEKALKEADSNLIKFNPNTDDKQIRQLHHCLFELFVGIDEDAHPITLSPAKNQINDYTNANELWRYINTLRKHGLIVEHGRGNVTRYKFAHDTLISDIQNKSGGDTDNNNEPSSEEHNKPHWRTLSQWWNKNTDFLKWHMELKHQLLKWMLDSRAGRDLSTQYLTKDQLDFFHENRFENVIFYIPLKELIEDSKRNIMSSIKRRNNYTLAILIIFMAFSSIAIFFAYSSHSNYLLSEKNKALAIDRLRILKDKNINILARNWIDVMQLDMEDGRITEFDLLLKGLKIISGECETCNFNEYYIEVSEYKNKYGTIPKNGFSKPPEVGSYNKILSLIYTSNYSQWVDFLRKNKRQIYLFLDKKQTHLLLEIMKAARSSKLPDFIFPGDNSDIVDDQAIIKGLNYLTYGGDIYQLFSDCLDNSTSFLCPWDIYYSKKFERDSITGGKLYSKEDRIRHMARIHSFLNDVVYRSDFHLDLYKYFNESGRSDIFFDVFEWIISESFYKNETLGFEWYDNIEPMDMPSSSYYNTMGHSFLNHYKFSIAVESFKKSISLNSKYVQSYIGLYYAYRGMSDSKKSVETLSLINNHWPKGYDQIMEVQSNFEFLMNNCQKLDTIDPEKIKYLRPLARLISFQITNEYEKKEEFSQSMDCLSKLLKIPSFYESDLAKQIAIYLSDYSLVKVHSGVYDEAFFFANFSFKIYPYNLVVNRYIYTNIINGDILLAEDLYCDLESSKDSRNTVGYYESFFSDMKYLETSPIFSYKKDFINFFGTLINWFPFRKCDMGK